MSNYSQHNEDEIIKSYFDDNYIGSGIDVGASDGVECSNTKYFEELGWYILCIEPNPRLYNKLVKNRHNAVNYAISNVNDNLIFNVVSLKDSYIHEDAISSLKIDYRLLDYHKKLGFEIDVIPMMVDALTLDTCIERFYKDIKIDFLNIDTEGTELDVLKGFSIQKWNPKVLVIENNFNDSDVEEYLKQFGYKKDKRIEINDFYTK
jgi:FkbM family methyltransferase